jgi:hypothetical protein
MRAFTLGNGQTQTVLWVSDFSISSLKCFDQISHVFAHLWNLDPTTVMSAMMMMGHKYVWGTALGASVGEEVESKVC